MKYAVPKEFVCMTYRDRWKWARNALAVQRTAWKYKRGIAACFYASGFETVKFAVDECGFLYDVWGEKYLIVKRRKCDNYAYLVSRFGVTRVRDWDND